MAIQLVVETGTGQASSTTYATVAEADQYLENSGRKTGAWSDAGTPGKQAALIQAWNYMIARWEGRWQGVASYKLQAGGWPRRDMVYPSGHSVGSNEIPQAVKHAQIEYAFNSLSGSLIPNPTYDDSGRPVIEKTEKVDVLMESTKYSDKSTPVAFREYPLADNLLKPFVQGGGSFDLLRA